MKQNHSGKITIGFIFLLIGGGNICLNYSFSHQQADEQVYGKHGDIYVSKFESEPLYQWYSKDKMMKTLHSHDKAGDDSDDEYLEHSPTSKG